MRVRLWGEEVGARPYSFPSVSTHCPMADPRPFSLTKASQSSGEAALGQGPCIHWEWRGGDAGASLVTVGV